jgi:hypothetical protein
MLEVGKTREGRFLIVFLLQFLTFSAFLAYHEVTAIPTDAITTMLTILMGMAPLGFVSAVNTVVAVEGVEMLAERYLRKRYEAGRAEGLKEGEERGVAKGEAQAWEAWEAWNQRRLAAEKAGQPFNEPPPELNHSK